MNRKYIVLSLALILSAFAILPATAITKAKSVKQTETLKYNAYWHWGFIWKLAGSGTLNLFEEQVDENTVRYHGQLCGRSLSIVETIMKVRDTLDCYYTPELIPIEYCKKTNEGSYKAIEHNYYHNYVNGKMVSNPYNIHREDVDSTSIDVYRWRVKKGNDRKTVSNEGVGFDMLSIFYELRNINFGSMPKNKRISYRITAGVKNKQVNITYKGKDNCTLKNGKKYPAYLVELTFSSKDSDSTPIQAWLSTDPDHRPLSVIIQLKRIGSVQGEIVE